MRDPRPRGSDEAPEDHLRGLARAADSPETPAEVRPADVTTVGPRDAERRSGPPLALTAVLLALLGMFGPFSIDTPFPAFAAMGADFGVSSAAMQQVVSAYLLAFAAMSLFHGPISDAVGRKPVMVTGAIVYALASIGCALAPSLPVLIAFRVLQGAAAGAGTIVSRTVVRDLYDGARAQRLMSAIAMIFGIAPAAAPILGGWLLTLGPWTTIFWFLTIFGAVLGIATLVLLPESHPAERRSPLAVRPLIANALECARQRHFQLLAGAGAFSFAAQFLYIASAPIIVVDLFGLGAQDFWVLFVPMVIAMVLGSAINGRLAGRAEGNSLVAAGQVVAFTGGVIGVTLALIPTTSGVLPWALVGLTGVAFGTGISLPIFQIAVLDAYPKARGTAASVSTFMMLMLNAALAGAIAPLATRSMLTLSATSLGLLVIGIAFWRAHLRHRDPLPGVTGVPGVSGASR